MRDRRTSRLGISAYEPRQRLLGSMPSPIYLEQPAPLLTFMSRSKILASNGLREQPAGQPQPLVEPLYSDPLPGSYPSATTSRASRRPEPIYATLSETLSSCDTLPTRRRRRRRHPPPAAVDSPPPSTDDDDDVVDDDDDDDDDDEENEAAASDDGAGSATESAGDDFEFHNTRSSRQTLVGSGGGSGGGGGGGGRRDAVLEFLETPSRAKVARSATYRILCNGLDVRCAKRIDPQSSLTASSESQHGVVTCVSFQVNKKIYIKNKRIEFFFHQNQKQILKQNKTNSNEINYEIQSEYLYT